MEQLRRFSADASHELRTPLTALRSVGEVGLRGARTIERFYRVDKSRSREMGGTGLGLSLVRWTAEAHGGWIDLETEQGRGSTFRLVLP